MIMHFSTKLKEDIVYLSQYLIELLQLEEKQKEKIPKYLHLLHIYKINEYNLLKTLHNYLFLYSTLNKLSNLLIYQTKRKNNKIIPSPTT